MRKAAAVDDGVRGLGGVKGFVHGMVCKHAYMVFSTGILAMVLMEMNWSEGITGRKDHAHAVIMDQGRHFSSRDASFSRAMTCSRILMWFQEAR